MKLLCSRAKCQYNQISHNVQTILYMLYMHHVHQTSEYLGLTIDFKSCMPAAGHSRSYGAILFRQYSPIDLQHSGLAFEAEHAQVKPCNPYQAKKFCKTSALVT